MRVFALLVRLRLLDLARRPLAGFFVLVMPVVLLVVVAGVFANGHPFERRRVSLISERIPEEAVARLPGVRVVRERSERAARGSLSSRMTDAVLVAEGDGARLLVRPHDVLFGRGPGSELPGGAALEVVPAPRWGYLHYLFPGMLALTVMLTGLYGMGYTMVRYRATQFLKKLSTTPLSRTTFVGAELASRTLMVLAQTLLMALSARLFFGLPLSPAALGWLLSLTAFGVLTFMGAGFSLACVIKVESNMQDTINAISAPLVLLSEIFFSADELPGPLPAIAAALPSTQLVRLTRAVLLQGETSAAALLPGLASLGAWLLATFALSLLVFRWND